MFALCKLIIQNNSMIWGWLHLGLPMTTLLNSTPHNPHYESMSSYALFLGDYLNPCFVLGLRPDTMQLGRAACMESV